MKVEKSHKTLTGLIAFAFILLSAVSAFAGPVTYTYDAANRLIYVNDNGTIIQYVYDKVGNLLERNKPLTIDPPLKDFGSISVGSTSAGQTVTISNVGTENLAISTVLINGPDITSFIIAGDTCSGRTLLPSSTCTIDAAFTPLNSGDKSASISISFAGTTNLSIDIPLQGSGSLGHAVTATAGSGGTIAPAGSVVVNDGATQDFTATPNSGYHITSINGCGGAAAGVQPTNSPYIYTTGPITADCMVSALFAVNSYTVMAAVAGDAAGGSVTPSMQSVSNGGVATFTVITNNGYTATVSEGTLSGGTWTIPNIASAHTVTVTFARNPNAVTVRLIDSQGNPLSGGVVQYYSGNWKNFGTTDATGRVTIELPSLATYSFSVTYGGATQQKSQNISANPTVVFQTGQVHSDSISCTQYYAGSWRTFTQDMELLPVGCTFHFSDGASNRSYTVVAATVNHIH